MTLTQWRKKKRMTRAEMARLLGLDVSSVYRLENGSTPRLDVAAKIAALTSNEVTYNGMKKEGGK